jgi:putative nucleotidyltransferase with HDIG domain
VNFIPTAANAKPAPPANSAKRYLDGLSSLPPAPMLVTKLLTLFRDPDCDIDQVVQLISFEPSITAHILRICNSAYAAGEQPPSDIFEAVSRVGFYQIYTLVVSLYGAKTKSIPGASRGLNVEDLWRHSVAVAVATSAVAEKVGQPKAVAFTAGLLHDIGKLVLASAEREKYASLSKRACDDGVLLTTLERSSFAIDHAELGGELMQRWDLPPDIVASVRYHHDLDCAPPYDQLTAAVQVGDMLAHNIFAEDLAHTDLLIPSTAGLHTLKIASPEIPRLLTKAKAEMEKVKGMLSL